MSTISAEPYEVSFQRSGGRSKRCVTGVLCPRPIPLLLGLAPLIYVYMGDAVVDWNEPASPGMQLLLEGGTRNV